MSAVVWLSPSPLWDVLLPQDPARFRAPALLRFAGDEFMDEFQRLLAEYPERLPGYVARSETWRRPAVGLETAPTVGSATGSPSSAVAGPGSAVLKLFQPIHGRYYLVTASLACRTPGLPEHTVELADGESVSFVIRRVGAAGELAWASAADGVAGWTPADPATLAPGEDVLPMFPTTFAADDLTRRVFAGLVPVGRREAYVGGRALPGAGANGDAAPAPADTISLEDPRVLELQRSVVDPWVSLRDWYRGEAEQGRAAEANVASEQASALILLDFATYFEEILPAVWQAILTPATAATLPEAQRTLYDQLGLTLWTRTGLVSVGMRQALRDAHEHREEIETLALPVDAAPQTVPPGVTPVLLIGDPHVPAAGLPAGRPAQIAATEAAIAALLARAAEAPEEAPGVRMRRLKHLGMQAVAALPPAAATAASGPAAGAAPGRSHLPLLAPLNPRGDDLYVVRCVYRRPRCGKGFPPLVSSASEPFELASFFDPDAPQRPVRVALPVDTTPAGLRRFDKNVGFMLSNELRKQMSRVKGMKELMDGDVQDPRGLDISVICSFSIPIITICALILLMLIVSLLNFVFFWIPFLMQCFPIPTLRAKD